MAYNQIDLQEPVIDANNGGVQPDPMTFSAPSSVPGQYSMTDPDIMNAFSNAQLAYWNAKAKASVTNPAADAFEQGANNGMTPDEVIATSIYKKQMDDLQNQRLQLAQRNAEAIMKAGEGLDDKQYKLYTDAITNLMNNGQAMPTRPETPKPNNWQAALTMLANILNPSKASEQTGAALGAIQNQSNQQYQDQINQWQYNEQSRNTQINNLQQQQESRARMVRDQYGNEIDTANLEYKVGMQGIENDEKRLYNENRAREAGLLKIINSDNEEYRVRKNAYDTLVEMGSDMAGYIKPPERTIADDLRDEKLQAAESKNLFDKQMRPYLVQSQKLKNKQTEQKIAIDKATLEKIIPLKIRGIELTNGMKKWNLDHAEDRFKLWASITKANLYDKTVNKGWSQMLSFSLSRTKELEKKINTYGSAYMSAVDYVSRAVDRNGLYSEQVKADAKTAWESPAQFVKDIISKGDELLKKKRDAQKELDIIKKGLPKGVNYKYYELPVDVRPLSDKAEPWPITGLIGGANLKPPKNFGGK